MYCSGLVHTLFNEPYCKVTVFGVNDIALAYNSLDSSFRFELKELCKRQAKTYGEQLLVRFSTV